MKCLTKSAEDKIKEAAIKVFLEKGFDGTTTRDIAKEAGVNSALMNYYFRSKEKLFASVFQEMLQLFFDGIIEIFNKPIPLKEKISEIIDHDFEMFKRNPDLSNFVIHELHRNPDRFFSAVSFDKIIFHSIFAQQLNDSIKAEAIKKIDIQHILLLMKSNVQFIFQGKVMTCKIWNMNDEEFDVFAEKHKVLVKEMITQYLFSSEK
ncbi:MULTISPECIES: TetR/AcrR family transcriptional regulator [unclassified Arcicella]|uniref:TetR/AcrR family transcriptional regulator n=1 Tax=unclassified Arcicella TaxID=2644986 RepID=UPI0028579874|nr:MULTISPECIES: TetR/AcrR family transcriptional regulator [unclassified Arcicella]MDR6560236.1 AcrR family transcriptional regulator [Arcicella sp. BE51]MDR6810158.1 AcrR family transcriptional regulator [Arcicella sp. BE140]MDR6821507.1 AcrR family transcriptional regulator [Arcicella sp. BE139]